VTGADLLRRVGLMPDGPAILGRPARIAGAGVYVVELADPLPRAPIDLALVGKWIERLDGLRLDTERPTSKALGARLASFWIPSAVVLYVGSTDRSIAGRIAGLEKHVLGDRQPHPSSQWLKTLRPAEWRVWWAATNAPEEYEDGVLGAFGDTVPADERAALYDSAVVLPFANLRTPSGERKKTGITGAVVPEEKVPPPPPTRVVDLPPGDADGLPEQRNSGTTRKTNTAPPPAPGVRRPKAATPAGRSLATAPASSAPSAAAASASPAGRPPVVAVELTPDGHARLVEELQVLTQERRPEVIDRIRKARELGDLRENADYTAAREEQSFLEGRIQAIEAQLRHAVVVAPVDSNRVALGSRVTVESDGEESVFTIVGPTESDPGSGRISSASPVGAALVGRSVGDDADVKTPRGSVRYRIVAIE
jgi:transcription elongation factor GreA